jgi:TolB-like protein
MLFAWAFEMTPEGVKREKDVDRSTSITQDTGRKLNRVIITVLVAAVGFLLVDKFVLQDQAPVAAEPSVDIVADSEIDKSVAVLPFVAMSNGPDDEYFADGLTEEILNSLAHLPELLVTARTSAFAFKGQDLPIPEIATTLGVAHVVEGSVRRAGDRLRITAQLIRASDGFHLWSEVYDRPSADSFGVQDEIAEKIASALDVVLDEDQRAQMRSTGLRNPEAFIAYQKGLEIFAAAHIAGRLKQLEMLGEANRYFAEALSVEPNASSIHFDSADYYVHTALFAGMHGGPSDDEVEAALEAAKGSLRKAMDTASHEGDRLNAALELAVISGEWNRMPQLFRAAADSDDCIGPSFWAAIGPLLPSPEAPMELWRKATECDPLNFYNWANLAALNIGNDNAAAAIVVATRGMQTVPHEQIADQLVMAHISRGEFDEALAATSRYVDRATGRTQNRFNVELARGNKEDALKLLDKLLEGADSRDAMVTANARLGDRDGANQAAALRDATPLGILDLLDIADGCRCGAPFDLEHTPNFARLIEEANLVWPPPATINWPLKDW